MRLHFLPTAFISAGLILSACGDGARRVHGDSCDSPGQCESGLCSEEVCIDPLSCIDLFRAANPGDDVTRACIAGLSSIDVEIAEDRSGSDGTIQFRAIGAFSSTTTGPTGGAGEGGSDSGSPVPSFDEGALAMALPDLTDVAIWSSSDPLVIDFLEGSAQGLGTVGESFGTAAATVTASVTLGDTVVSGSTTAGSARITDSDDDGVPDESDNCPETANPGQEDTNSNGIGDACEGGGDTP